LEEEIEVFEYQYPNGSIIPYYVSESAAVDSLMADRTQLIVITHELDKDQINYIKKKNKRIVRQNCIAVDAVALIVNKNNPVGQLTMSEIQDILLGKITNWNQLAGNDTTKIKLVFDNAGSSTVSYMRNKFLPEGRMISDNPNAFGQKNNAQVFDIVKKDKDALGIISVSWLGDNLQATKVPMDKKLESLQNETDTIPNNLTTEINILKVRKDDEITGYKPYQAYINSGEYPLFRKVYMISTGSNSTVAHSFYTFVTGFVGQKIISLTGVMPYHVNQRLVELK
jgi:phosphate transport system substrate-binding protein